MANIMLNDICNQHCAYCFATAAMEGDHSTDISYENFKKAVQWINRMPMPDGNPGRIGLIGGEPLLHGDLESILSCIRQERLPGQEVIMFTNGVLLDKYIDLLSANNITLLINVNSPEDIGDKYYKTKENIGLALKKQINTSIGLNYYKPGMDTGFIEDIIKEYGYKSLRIGIISPNTEEKRKKGPFKYFEDTKQPLLDFITRLAKLGCAIHFDCQKLPKCVIGDQIEYINNLNNKYKVSNQVFENAACTPVIDIKTDLTVLRCFGVSEGMTPIPLDVFDSELDAMKYFATNVDNKAMTVRMDKRCNGCYEKMLGNCQGGCIGFKLPLIRDIITATNCFEIKRVEC